MGSYLDNYGVKDAKRERLIKRILLSLLTVMVVSVTLWFFFRDYREEGRIRDFLAALQRKDFPAAYEMFGCSQANPCRDYGYERFLEDWGPNSAAADPSAIQREKVKSCDHGIIQVLKVKGEEIILYVDRENLTVNFSPWPVCTPRVKV